MALLFVSQAPALPAHFRINSPSPSPSIPYAFSAASSLLNPHSVSSLYFSPSPSLLLLLPQAEFPPHLLLPVSHHVYQLLLFLVPLNDSLLLCETVLALLPSSFPSLLSPPGFKVLLWSPGQLSLKDKNYQVIITANETSRGHI